MTVSAIAALVAVVLSVGTNFALYVHLSSTMNGRFDSIERKFESKLDGIERKFDSKFDIIERKFDSKFESVERRLEMILGSLHEMDVRLTRLESRP